MATNNFYPAKFYDHTIVDSEGLIIGHIRVKPSGILWAPRRAKVFYRLKLDDFAAHMEKEGTQITK